MRLTLGVGWRSLLLACFVAGAGCKGCILGDLVKLPDLGTIDPDELVFEKIMGDPAPLTKGGTTTYGGITIETTISGADLKAVYSTSQGVFQTFDHPNGDDSVVTGSGDINFDGKEDWQYTSGYDGTAVYTSTEISDTNFDGTFDRKTQWIVDVSKGVPYNLTATVWRYLDATGMIATGTGGTWTQDWTYTGPAVANAGGSCFGQDGFPDINSNDVIFTSVGNSAQATTQIKIVENAAGKTVPGACSHAEAATLQVALRAALEDIPDCMLTINPSLAAQVKDAVQTRPLYVGCGNACAGVDASTDLPFSITDLKTYLNPSGYQRLNVNPAYLDGKDEVYVESYLLHELLHFSGKSHEPMPEGNPPGHDRVYGCGRFCVRGGLANAQVGGCHVPTATGGWPENAMPTPMEFAFDCADCADDDYKKRAFCGAGLLKIPECNNADCSLNKSLSCDANATCCQTIAVNCWGDGAYPESMLGTRDVHLKSGETPSACIASGTKCTPADTSTGSDFCQVGNPVNSLSMAMPPQMPCLAFPIAGDWCHN